MADLTLSNGPLKRVCVFCGSHAGRNPAYRETAIVTGQLLARRGITLVYGGGNVGLMGAVADACLEAGGQVIGCIPKQLLDRELAHQGLTELHVVESMHQRKQLMADLSDAFIALPGGIGTFEELFEIWTWSLLGIQRKATGLVNVDRYYDHLIGLADHAVAEGFLKPEPRELLMVDTDPARLLDRIAAFQPGRGPGAITGEAR